MLKGLRWLLQGLLGAVVLVVAVWTVSRLWPQSRAERETVTLLEQDAPRPGSNAFARLWLLGYDGIAEDRLDELLAEDVARHRQALAALPEDAYPSVTTFNSVATTGFVPVANVENFCRWRESGCLRKVRLNETQVAAALEGQQALLQRIARLAQDGHYRNPFAPDPAMLMPPFKLLSRALPAHALAHVQGRSDEALQGLCTDTLTGRMLMSHSDSLVAAMTGAAMIESNGALLGEVLAELPRQHPLPAVCERAFAPAVASELTVCQPMRGEFALSSAAIPHLNPWPQSLLLDREKTRGRMARQMAWPCGKGGLEALARDEPARAPTSHLSLWQLECAANPIGCTLSDIAAPAYADYSLRPQDAGAQLRLVAALLWLREQPSDAPAEALLPRLPANLANGPRTIRVSDDGRSLQLDRYWLKQGAVLSLPLPEGLARP
ncbi:MAG: hypothetical protein ACOH1V_13110 [Stenotrophomonas sp.]